MMITVHSNNSFRDKEYSDRADFHRRSLEWSPEITAPLFMGAISKENWRRHVCSG